MMGRHCAAHSDRGNRQLYIQPDGEFMSQRQATKTRRRARAVSGIVPDDLYDYIDEVSQERIPAPASKSQANAPSLDHWTVSDDWPERVPVTEAEIDLFEAWFGDIIDELFGKPG